MAPAPNGSSGDATTLETLVGLCVGNTRTRLALLRAGQIEQGASVDNTSIEAVVRQACALASGHDATGFVVAGVQREVMGRLDADLAPHAEVYLLGRDLEIRLNHSLDDASTLGQDRLLNAIGAFATLKEACAIVDAGTAVTVDFVDGTGVFHGGVIAPGLAMMMRAMHEHTSALPKLAYERPDPARGPFGKDTPHAMRLGATNALLGLVRYSVEQFAEKYEAFPMVVATGGDAGVLSEDPLIDRVVPDLQMMGLAEVCRRELGSGDESDAE